MTSCALAEKQLPRWEIEDIEFTSPSREQPGPSDLLEQARPFMNVGAAPSMGAVQGPKHQVFISYRRCPQGFVAVTFRPEQIARRVADLTDISTSQPVTFEAATTSEWHDIRNVAFKIRPTFEEAKIRITGSIEPSGRVTLYPFESAAATSSPVENLQNRYKELSSRRYMESLTAPERLELQNIEEQLDEFDTHDTDLQRFVGQVDEGYDKLRRGLQDINGILDDLLRR